MAHKTKGHHKWIDKVQAYTLFCTKVNGRYPTMQDVATTLNRRLDSILRLGAKEKWVERRNNAIKTAIEKFREEMVDISKAESYKEFEDWNLVEEVLITALETIKTAQQNYLEAPSPEAKLLAWKVLNKLSYDMLNLTTSLKTAKNQKRTLLGLPTDITKGELTHDTKSSGSLQELQDMAEFIRNNYKAPDKNDITTTPTNT